MPTVRIRGTRVALDGASIGQLLWCFGPAGDARFRAGGWRALCPETPTPWTGPPRHTKQRAARDLAEYVIGQQAAPPPASRLMERKTTKRKTTKRTTPRSWMRNPRYTLTWTIGLEAPVRQLNLMMFAEKLCRRKGWARAVDMAAVRTGAVRHAYPTATAISLWARTMTLRGACARQGGIRIHRSAAGRDGGSGGPSFGVSLTVPAGAGPQGILPTHDIADTLMTLLHEVAHVVHLGSLRVHRAAGKRRPHDLAFNVIQGEMARQLWGYDFDPYAAGFSVGHGYAPSKHLRQWLSVQLLDANPRVICMFALPPPA